MTGPAPRQGHARPGPLLLDTHVWIWMAEGDERKLGAGPIDRIEEAGRQGLVLLHPMSVWEVGTLVRKRRIAFTSPVEDWVEQALGLPGIFLLDLSPRSALQGALLSSDRLTDPVDRMLVAAARIEDATLVTADDRILAFAESGAVRVLAAR
jgi:PIN domain nuclease of toxin-antitoxin system